MVVFGLVVFHAPISVFLGQYLSPEIVKGWKEIILLLLIPFVLFLVYRAGLLKKLSNDRLMQIIGVYVLLHLVLVFFFQTTTYQKVAGLAIDLRYMLFFVLVFCAVILWPKSRNVFIKIGIGAAIISISFALLQATLLPNDVLKYIGYSSNTISPYLTVDKNSDYIRINGTLRGPNPLGAYVGILFSILLAWALAHKKTAAKNKWILTGIGVLLLTVLWASYSRSAFLALLASVAVILFVSLKSKINFRSVSIGIAVVFVMVGSVVALRDSSLVQNVILHNNPSTGSSLDSNQAHADSLDKGVERVILQPFGAGIGSTGSASLGSSKPLIIENQYLFVAHEAGWFGLGLFAVIYIYILACLYKYRRDWLSLGVFASGIGLAIVGILLPVWADDTISLVWFGLAAIALGSHYKREAKKDVTSN